MTDYLEMDGPELHAACGADGAKWAAAFCQYAEKYNGAIIDEGFALSWFCNAMMAMHDHMRPGLAPVVLPDGSAFCVG